ncbi:DUF3644 domain-containing protein [Yersinia aldovae]|uniref:DUF3644 domain-containing protein n=1 Tax=Yersinia aldovae TaxID=29483 RepID=UPI001C973928|nr:DUF3644 domain-containing protein [Yersinia aldovae]
MNGKVDKIDLAFSLFLKMKRDGILFELEDVQDATGWGKATVKTYFSKKWSSFLKKTEKGIFVAPQFDYFNIGSFRQHHSQTEAVKTHFYHSLLEKAVAASVTAIEIYNKPDFKFREESFSILMINAWELLLKARLVQLNDDNQDAIYQKNKGDVVLSQSGNPKTISVSRAISLLESIGGLNKIVADNIRLLIVIRDECVHFISDDNQLCLKIQAIGTASLKNFMTLAMQWFEYNFNRFNFYLMPVSFYHLTDMCSFSIDDNSRANVFKFLNDVEHEHDDDDDSNFSISLRLETKLVKTSSDEAVQFRVTDDPDAPELHIVEEDALKNHPYTYMDLCELLKNRYADFKRNSEFNNIMRSLKTQGEKFCKERKLDPNNVKSIYKTFYSSRIVEEFDKHYIKK